MLVSAKSTNSMTLVEFLLGYTRISDFHHHWHDVFVGGIVGSLIAFVTFKFILNWRHYDPRFLPYTASTHPNGALAHSGDVSIAKNNRSNNQTSAF